MATFARFTPSLLDHGTLEQLFVNREPLLEEVLTRIERATRSPERAHKLLVGPRGAGKTHLVSLVYHRARQSTGFGTTFQLAWLPEDPWTIDSLDDFLGEVLDRLEPTVEVPPGRSEDKIVQIARERGPIVVLVENLDQVLHNIGPEGQRRLRALLETDRPLLLIATATKLTEYLISQAEPFYGFFDTTTLRPFDVDEAAAMLQAIAKLDGNDPLVHRLDEPGTRARLAAIDRLAGGQPRVWALFGTGLSVDALEELVSALLERFDDLTPYYQEQLGRLSPNERKVVRTLAAADRAMTVRNLATTTGIGQQSLAKTITDLRRSGWVRERTGLLMTKVDQRLHFYELAEPLVRLAFQLKSSRGEPVKLVLDFLTAWFDRDVLASAATDVAVADAYLRAAQETSLREPVVLLCHDLSGPGGERIAVDLTIYRYAPRVLDDNPVLVRTLAALDDALVAYQRGNATALLEQPTELSRLMEHRLGSTSVASLRLDLSSLALAQVVDDPTEWSLRTEDALGSAREDEIVAALLLLARWHLRASQDDLAGLLIERTVRAIQRAPNSMVIDTAIDGAEELIRSGHPAFADVLLPAVGLLASADRQVIVGVAREAINLRLGRPSVNVTLWETIVRQFADLFGNADARTLTVTGRWAESYRSMGRFAEALAIQEQLVVDSERMFGPDHPNSLIERNNLANSYHSIGRLEEATAIGEQVVIDSERVLGSDHPNTLSLRSNLAASYDEVGRAGEAIAIKEQVVVDIERILGPDHPNTLVARNNLASSYDLAGRTNEAIAIQEQVVIDSERVLGPDHPSALVARNNLASWYDSAGRLEEAIAIEERLVADRQRVLGSDHPHTLVTQSNLASSYRSVGRTEEALAVQEQAVAGFQRVLGPDHPKTVAVANALQWWKAMDEGSGPDVERR